MGSDGQLRIVDVADVGEDAILVHDAHREDPSLAFALVAPVGNAARTHAIGVFRAVDRLEYAGEVQRQLVDASERRGPGDLGALLRSGGTWNVG